MTGLQILLTFTKGGTSADAGAKYDLDKVATVEMAKSAIKLVCKLGGITNPPSLREMHGSEKWREIVELTIERTDRRITDRRSSRI